MPHRRSLNTALLCLICVAVLGLCEGSAMGGSSPSRNLQAVRTTQAETALQQMKVTGLRQQINSTRSAVWRTQDSLMQARSKTDLFEQHTRSLKFLRWGLERWNKRLQREKQQARQVLLARGYLPPAQARILGHWLAAKLYGWTGAQWDCLNELWGTKNGRTLESGWYALADNPRSPAHGIPQADPGSKMGAGWWSSAYAQIKWGLKYIRTNRNFHDPCRALSYRLDHGSY